MKKKILFVTGIYPSFIKWDYELLSKSHDVTLYKFDLNKNPISLIVSFFKLFYHLLKNNQYDIYLSWFVDYHSFLPSFFGKKRNKQTIISIAGYDSVYLPQFNYGLFGGNKLRKSLAFSTFKNASDIISCDESMIKGINTFIDKQPIKIGYKNYVQNTTAKDHIIRFGYKTNDWESKTPLSQRKNNVLTIGRTTDLINFKRKGYHFIFEIAKIMPQTNFTIIGLLGDAKKYADLHAPRNVKVHSFVDHNKVLDYYQNHKVFAQLSLAEGQPNTLGEAIFSGCIPVGTNVNGIPFVIGDTNLIVDKNDINQMKEVIERAFSYTEEQQSKILNRAKELFSIEKRETELLDILK